MPAREARAGRLRPLASDALATFVCAFPFALVTLVVRYGPSTVDPCTSPLLLKAAPLVAFLGLLAVTIPILACLAASGTASFIARAAFACVFATSGSALFGGAVHRDYFTAVFQYLLAFLALFLYWLRSQPSSQVSSGTFRSLGRAGYAIFFLFSAWIMMMGYAISTRAEPRPIESVLYNSYNALLDLVIFLGSRELVLRSYKTLALRSDGAVLLDGAPIDFVLGAAGVRILKAFLASPERRATCADIARQAAEEGRTKRRSDCASCDAADAKASLCPEYRATYNRLLELKKLLEFLEVGSILPPKNKRRILAEGWRLALFENVRLESGARARSHSKGEAEAEGLAGV